jgi:hypothetical protein
MIARLGFDQDSLGRATLASVFIAVMAALLVAVLILGLVLFYSWEAEWFLRASSWGSPNSSFGLFF